MNKEFDFSSIGKRMPYTVPSDFFDKLEQRVKEQVIGTELSAQTNEEHTESAPGSMVLSQQPRSRNRSRLVWTIASGLVAASVALFFIFHTPGRQPRTGDFATVEQAYSGLSSADQHYLMTVYQNDEFISNDAM